MDLSLKHLAFSVIICQVALTRGLDVDVTGHCGETVVVGKNSTNGFITLFPEGGPAQPMNVSNNCTVMIKAKAGLSLHLRFLYMNFPDCDARITVYAQDPTGIAPDESIISSHPDNCAIEIPVKDPVDNSLSASDDYKVVFIPDQKGTWKTASFTFDYTTITMGSDEDLVWPIIPTTTALPMTTSAASAGRDHPLILMSTVGLLFTLSSML